jgi:hypothetical protein
MQNALTKATITATDDNDDNHKDNHERLTTNDKRRDANEDNNTHNVANCESTQALSATMMSNDGKQFSI